jgi:hypothetical protein
MRQQSAGDSFLIVYQVFVIDLQNAPRHGLLPMCHQLVEQQVVAARIQQIERVITIR